mmetsp:Transcript_13729/g.29949  ORF Transcript_13729/g.29949 Transcript_13729/m.29949 type:complete len:561 (+) Transcript_13729:107-1789(+)
MFSSKGAPADVEDGRTTTTTAASSSSSTQPSASSSLPRVLTTLLGGCTSACGVDEARTKNFTYAGSNKGSYVQECKYKYVGPGGGHYSKPPPPPAKKRNCCPCISLLLLALLAGFLIKSGINPQDLMAAAMERMEGPSYNCLPDGLEPGERVRSAADIAFKPSGFLPQGSYGIVVSDQILEEDAGDDDSSNKESSPKKSSGERVVTVAWDDIAGLQNARVFRDMLTRSIETGDRVEAVAAMEYKGGSEVGIVVAPSLETADLVRAAEDLGGVKMGTYGTVVMVGPSGNLPAGHVIVRFVTQLDTVKVGESKVVRAPQVGDRVRARADILGEDGLKAAKKGTLGTLVEVSPTENGFAFTFTVEWSNDKRTQVWEAQVESLSGPEGSLIPTGSKGKVTRTLPLPPGEPLSEQQFVVQWDGVDGAGSLVDRSRLQKTETWSTQKLEFCQSAGVVTPTDLSNSPGVLAKPKALPSATKESPVADGDQSTLFDCGKNMQNDWSVKKATWCCQHEGVGCEEEEAPELPEAGSPALAPPPIPRSFDPSPHLLTPQSEVTYGTEATFA